MNLKNKKCLIAYYSRKGQNYVSGKIVDLVTGNTEIVANIIREITSSDMFKIESVKDYPIDYTETTEVAKKELHSNTRPKLKNYIVDIDSYDVIFLGYPNWWGTFPMPVFTFLESYDFGGKIIIPFCTHEGSGLGNSGNDIAKLCPKANILKGIAIHGTKVDSEKKNIVNWLDKIDMV